MKIKNSFYGILAGNKIIVTDKRNIDKLIQKGFGELKKEKEGRKLVLDLFEGLFLLKNKRFAILDLKGNKINEFEIQKIAKKESKEFYLQYLVFEDLRNRGYCVKTGFKFGFEFRVYPKGKLPGESHSEAVVCVLPQNKRISMVELNRMVRLAKALNTELILAVIDSEDEINYYKIERKKL
ncbi:MAG: tRNA-intron lyase [Candidatus Diapherotrites archaeon]|nr:tRNA-intron lyase [Candidatus Diapherotrites archaeon]